MLVGKRMNTNPAIVSKDFSLKQALELTKKHRIRHLPVVDGKKLLGIVSDRDLRQASASSATALEIHELRYLLDRIKVSEIMTKKVITTTPDTPIEVAAKIMRDNMIGCLPVVDKDEFVGLITETEILDIFLEVMGIHEPSSRLELELPDRPGVFADITAIIKGFDINIVSVITIPHAEGENGIVIMRIKTMNPEPVVKAIQKAGYRILSSISS